MKTSRNLNIHSAFSLVELVCVLAIISALVGMFFPAVQSIREASRGLVCRNNLRGLGMASLNYESAHQNLPPGNLGFANVLVSRSGFSERWENDTNFRYYWKNAQHSSSLAFLLPYMEESNIYERLPKVFWGDQLYGDYDSPPHDWIGGWSEVEFAMQSRIQTFFCPSDNLVDGLDGVTPIIGAQPVYFTNTTAGVIEGYLGVTVENRGYQSSNFIGCAGAYSGGQVPNRSLELYRGVLGCRDETKLASITDGTTNTMLYGETLGAISESKRLTAFVWTFGCIGRGRGGLPWGKTENPRIQERTLLGDWQDSALAGFGSKHPMVVNVVTVGGSVQPIRRNVELNVWYALCGMADGGGTVAEH